MDHISSLNLYSQTIAARSPPTPWLTEPLLQSQFDGDVGFSPTNPSCQAAAAVLGLGPGINQPHDAPHASDRDIQTCACPQFSWHWQLGLGVSFGATGGQV